MSSLLIYKYKIINLNFVTLNFSLKLLCMSFFCFTFVKSKKFAQKWPFND